MQENPWRTLNARQEPNSMLLERFVENDFFWARFNPVNEIVVGTGGSGKTAMFKMMSLPLLSSFVDERAQEIVKNRSYVGVYVPLLLYLGNIVDLQKLPENVRNDFFVKAFNLICCRSFLTTLMKYIELYHSENGEAVRDAVHNTVKHLWMTPYYQGSALADLKTALSADWLSLQSDIRNSLFKFDPSSQFNLKSMTFFSPISTLVESLAGILDIPDRTFFLILIDEAEFLSDYQRIQINSLLRSEQKPFVFKIATVPFVHTNLKTINPSIVLRQNQDFQMVSIDKFFTESGNEKFKNFASRILRKRLLETKTNERIDVFDRLLHSDYDKDAVRILGLKDVDALLLEFYNSLSEARRKSVDIKTILAGGKRDNKVTNKYLAVFCTKRIFQYYFRSGFAHIKPSWYYGGNLLLRVSEGNLRRFIKLINLVYPITEKIVPYQVVNSRSRLTDVARSQNEAIADFVEQEYQITSNSCGVDAAKLFDQVCRSLSAKFYAENGVTDYATSFLLDNHELDAYERVLLDLIKEGRIVPENYEAVSLAESGPKWRISYLFAVKFWIHMRWGTPLYSRNFLKLGAETDQRQLNLWSVDDGS